MAKEPRSVGEALDRWREAEHSYAQAVNEFMLEAQTATPMDKDQLIDLVRLRAKADKWRERYYTRQAHID